MPWLDLVADLHLPVHIGNGPNTSSYTRLVLTVGRGAKRRTLAPATLEPQLVLGTASWCVLLSAASRDEFIPPSLRAVAEVVTMADLVQDCVPMNAEQRRKIEEAVSGKRRGGGDDDDAEASRRRSHAHSAVLWTKAFPKEFSETHKGFLALMAGHAYPRPRAMLPWNTKRVKLKESNNNANDKGTWDVWTNPSRRGRVVMSCEEERLLAARQNQMRVNRNVMKAYSTM